MSERVASIASLRSTIERTIGSLLEGQPRVALLDFPNHANVGDSAIWIGELSCLRALGIAEPCYTCDVDTYDERQLRKQLGAGTILIHGGGNLGDLWQEHHRFRELILERFPDNRVIQLPQSIWFQSAAALARARAVINAHPNFVLLVREQQSLEIARNEFRATTLLCPDSAFHLGPLPRPAQPSQPVLWLARTDLEAKPDSSPDGLAPGATDWMDEPSTFLRMANHWLGRTPRRARALRRLLSGTYESLARQRVQRGCRLLSRGQVVVTDRLHAHILCLLLGISHVLLDNSYGKLSSFYHTWTADFDLAQWADSADQALALASRDARALAPGQA